MNSDGSEMISRVKRIYLRENKKENLFEFRLFQRRPSDGINFRKEKEKTYYETKPRTYFLLCRKQMPFSKYKWQFSSISHINGLSFWKSKCGLGYMDLFGIQTAAEF